MSHKLWSRFPLQVRHRYGGVRAFHFNRGYYFSYSFSIWHCLLHVIFQLKCITRVVGMGIRLHQYFHQLCSSTIINRLFCNYKMPPNAAQTNHLINGALSARSGTYWQAKPHQWSNACNILFPLFVACLCYQAGMLATSAYRHHRFLLQP